MVVLLLALLVGPVAGAHPRLDEQLVALARISGECLAHGTKRHEPQAGHHLAGGTLFVLARIVVAHQAEARVTAVTLGHQFRVTRQIVHRGQRETVHEYSSRVLVWRVGSQSIHAAGDWNGDWPSV